MTNPFKWFTQWSIFNVDKTPSKPKLHKQIEYVLENSAFTKLHSEVDDEDEPSYVYREYNNNFNNIHLYRSKQTSVYGETSRYLVHYKAILVYDLKILKTIGSSKTLNVYRPGNWENEIAQRVDILKKKVYERDWSPIND